MKAIARIAATLLLLAAPAAQAQELRSAYFMHTSRTRHQLNPALLDSAYMGIPFLSQMNYGTTGNVGLANFVYKSQRPGYDLTTFMSPEVSASEFLGSLHEKNRLDIYANMALTSVAFRGLGGTNLVELNLRSNTNLSLPYGLFEFAKEAGARQEYSFGNIGLRTQNYLELALGHSHRIGQRLTVGAKAKLLLGLAYADFSVDRMDVTMNGDEWAIRADAQLRAAVGGASFSIDPDPDPETVDPERGGKVDGLDDYSFSLPGWGLAFDLGATYRVTDHLTLSAAVTDLGFISWRNVCAASSRGEYAFTGFSDIWVSGENDGNKLGDQFDDLGDDLSRVFSVYDDGQTSHTQALAATINVGAEYVLPAYERLRFGLLYTSRIHGLYTFHQALLGATVQPTRWFEATLNTSVSSTGWQLGGVVNFSAGRFNLFVGSDRLVWGKLGKQYIPLHRVNTNLTFGMNVRL